MDIDEASQIHATCLRFSHSVNELFRIVSLIEDGDEKSLLIERATNLALEISGWYNYVETRFPELLPPEDKIRNDIVDPKTKIIAAKLSVEELMEIDNGLLAHCSNRWRKTAYVIGSTMMDFGERFRGLSDSYYLTRIIELIESNVIEVDGDVRFMRHSELRLTGDVNRDEPTEDEPEIQTTSS